MPMYIGITVTLGVISRSLCMMTWSISSPGGLPNGLTEADLLQGRSEIRNRVLARVFRELGYIEHWGSGLQRIKQMCEAENLPTPEFLETNDFLM